MSKSTSTAADVRTWAVAQGITEGHGSRGRLSAGLIESFNAAHKGAPYATGGKPSTIALSVKLTNSAGKAYGRKVNKTPAEVRTLAGVPNGKGRVSAEVIAQAAQALSVTMQAEKDNAVQV